MPRNFVDRVARSDVLAQRSQRAVLRRFKVEAFEAFQLDADGVVIAIVAAPVAGRACMPGALVAIHKLPQRPRARDKKVRGYL